MRGRTCASCGAHVKIKRGPKEEGGQYLKRVIVIIIIDPRREKFNQLESDQAEHNPLGILPFGEAGTSLGKPPPATLGPVEASFLQRTH